MLDKEAVTEKAKVTPSFGGRFIGAVPRFRTGHGNRVAEVLPTSIPSGRPTCMCARCGSDRTSAQKASDSPPEAGTADLPRIDQCTQRCAPYFSPQACR